MKNRKDFVSNSSTSSFIIPIDKINHDKSKWHKNSLRIQPDNGKIQMEFEDFEFNGSLFDSLYDNWKFVCDHLIYWVIPGVIDGTNMTKAKLVRKLYNSEEFQQLNKAVKDYFKETEGIEMQGVEFDEEDIKDDQQEDMRYLRPQCQLNHQSIYDNFEDMMKQSGCSSIAELIWGVKEITFERD